MNRAEALGILASLFLLAMGYLDHHWPLVLGGVWSRDAPLVLVDS